MTRRRDRGRLGALCAAFGLVFAVVAGPIPLVVSAAPIQPTVQTVVAAAGSDPVIAAAGDIACDPADSKFNGGQGVSNGCRQGATSNLLVNAGLTAVLALGDDQYYCGSYQAFVGSYGPSWGRVKSITYPSVGNHEYLTNGGSGASTGCDASNANAAGYYRYYGSAAGDPTRGYYSFNIGAWHLVALNTQCSSVGGCSANSPQGKWLAADLDAHPNQCTLAFFHIPLFSSGGRASSNSNAMWQILYAHHADVVLNGHDHVYERFAPQTPTGSADPANGIREFIVGTGGANLTSFASTAANSQVRNNSTFGVLGMTLHPTGYDWQFVPEAGKTFTDAGSGTCHASGGGGGGGGDTSKPTVPAITSATAPSSGRVDVAWTTSTDNVGVTGYTIYRNGTSVGTTNGPTATSFSDLTVSPSTTYSYTVDAFDAAGNHSAPSLAALVTTPASSATTTLTPVADAYVDTSQATKNYGTSTALRVDSSPIVRSYLAFNLSGVSGTITKATLRVYANSASSAGYTVGGVAGSWTETGINGANAPPVGAAIGSSGSFSANSWTSVDVTALLGAGNLSLALSGISSTAVKLSSRESGATAPQLVLELGGGPPPPPTASFTASATTITAGLPVSFTDTSSGSPTSWSWTFGDGGTSTLQNPSHTWSAAGPYTVSLVATNAAGPSSPAATATITVNPGGPPPPPPTASFTASATTITAGLPVSFTDTSSGSPTSWSWTFGDGGTSTLQNPSHTWTTTGPQLVSLVATNAAGPSSPAATATITVNPDGTPPSDPTSFTATPGGTTSVNLAWGASSDNVAVTGYEIFRNGSLVPLVVLGPGAVSYPDTGLTPATLYSYTIWARDAAGNHSNLVGPRTATTGAVQQGPLTLTAVADAYVDASNPTSNYGSSTSLRFDGSPTVQSYLRFDLSGVSGTITRATLRVYANSASSAGYTVGGVAGAWTELGITATNAPSVGTSIGSSGSFSANSWTSVDVTALLGGSSLSLAMSGINSTNVRLSSRESGATAPQLVLEFGP